MNEASGWHDRAFAPPIHQITREVKKEEFHLYNLLLSCIEDAAFVREIRSLYHPLPTLANLRCGAWHTRAPDGTCRFKSIDGHNNAWNFSLARLNLHVAHLAAERGGCLIVDATRRGKKFPDALSKTVPIWCCVLNRAIRRLQLSAGLQPAGSTIQAHASLGPRSWLSGAEAPGDDDELGSDAGDDPAAPSSDPSSASSAPLSGPTLATTRPNDSASSAPPAASQSDSPQPHVGPPAPPWDLDLHLPPWITHVEAASVAKLLDGWVDLLLHSGPDLSALAAAMRRPFRPLWITQQTRIFTNAMPKNEELAFTPIVLISASRQNSRPQRDVLELPWDGGLTQHPFWYIPGAGDDEESWSRGLTADLMWQHREALVRAGRGEIEALVDEIVAAAAAGGSRQRDLEGRGQRVSDTMDEGRSASHGHAGTLSGGSVHVAAVERDFTGAKRHVLPARGLVQSMAAAGKGGVYWIGCSPLALAAIDEVTDSIRGHVDLILHVGEKEPPDPRARLQLAGPTGPSSTCCTAGPDLLESEGRRWVWIPMIDTKRERQVMLRRLDSTLRAVYSALGAGKRVLLVDDTGTDHCVCVCVAALAAGFLPPESGAREGIEMVQGYVSPEGPFPERQTKDSIRRWLSVVSADYPRARPRQPSLKQVFQFFMPPSASAASGAPVPASDRGDGSEAQALLG